MQSHTIANDAEEIVDYLRRYKGVVIERIHELLDIDISNYERIQRRRHRENITKLYQICGRVDYLMSKLLYDNYNHAKNRKPKQTTGG